ncbi:MAG TPA: endonuclease/exonuclease/phosphatase family protein [Geomonas sp.]|nr:endonuclease/exonuclease/phosphatase family protein [Geomonas sp.]
MTKKHCSFTIMTYNVHRLIGNDRHTSAARIAEVVETYHPDIVALQELPGGRYRPEESGTTLALSHELALLDTSRELIYLERERNGNVVYSRHPMRLIRAGGLHPESRRRSIVPRGVLWVEIDICGRRLQLLNTHLGLTPPERGSQTKVLISSEWLGHPECKPPIVLCGDFNLLPSSPLHRRLKDILDDRQEALSLGHTEWTFPSHYPMVRFDHLFISPNLTVENLLIPQTKLTRVASDHLPLVVTLRLD